MRGTPAMVTGSDNELWNPISKPSISDWATSEHRAGRQIEEARDERRRRERDRQPEDDADPLAHRRPALGEGEAEACQDDSDNADRLGDRTGQRVHDRGERRLPGHG